MENEETIYDRLQGLKPANEDLIVEIKEKIDSTLPEIIEAVEQREILATLSRYRELEVLREMQKKV